QVSDRLGCAQINILPSVTRCTLSRTLPAALPIYDGGRGPGEPVDHEAGELGERLTDGAGRQRDELGHRVTGPLAGQLACLLQHRSEEHTSELQSRENLVCRLLLEKKNEHPATNNK